MLLLAQLRPAAAAVHSVSEPVGRLRGQADLTVGCIQSFASRRRRRRRGNRPADGRMSTFAKHARLTHNVVLALGIITHALYHLRTQARVTRPNSSPNFATQ